MVTNTLIYAYIISEKYLILFIYSITEQALK